MSPSRRALLRSTVWAVPAVTVAAAAPSYATSGAPALVFRDFDVTPVQGSDVSGWFYDVTINALTVGATGNGVAQRVTLTIAFAPDGGANMDVEDSAAVISWTVPGGWTLVSAPVPGQSADLSLHWLSGDTVSSTTPVSTGAVPLSFGTGFYFVVGVFSVTASAPGYTSVTRTFHTGPVPPEARVAGTESAGAPASALGLSRSR